ncbi:hypothetical protein APV28_1144 [Comamonas testosteroni]|nr:hypothetical protein APV28_1144 [Comamonas testosteroni]
MILEECPAQGRSQNASAQKGNWFKCSVRAFWQPLTYSFRYI